MSNYARFAINLALNAFNISLNNELSLKESRHIFNDSRNIQQGDIFAATLGQDTDGRHFITHAIKAGAELIITQCDDNKSHGKVEVIDGVTCIHFFELNTHLFRLANLFYQQPHKKLTTIGITGTNGKTTVSQITAQLLELCEKPCFVIGTTGAGTLSALSPITNTTPGPTELNQLLSRFVKEGASHVALEISSHALSQKRISPAIVDVAVFTNLSRDHLDYHLTMENYAQAKEKLFTQHVNQVAILNGDDECSHHWLKHWNTQSSVIVYGLKSETIKNKQYVHASNLTLTASGVEFDLVTHIGSVNVMSTLIGDFNVSNVLASAAVLISQGFTLKQLSTAIHQLKPVAGRMEMFSMPHLPTAIIDYAHTPDALENALKVCKKHTKGKVHVVFGCGGDRDKGKRPLMGNIAEQYADQVLLTNDNPRNESPEAITQDILAGCKAPQKINVILPRQKAVAHAIGNAKQQDIILFAGKGHEQQLVVGNEVIKYNEREFVQSFYINREVS